MGPRVRTPTGATAACAGWALRAATATPTSTTASPVRARGTRGCVCSPGLGQPPRAQKAVSLCGSSLSGFGNVSAPSPWGCVNLGQVVAGRKEAGGDGDVQAMSKCVPCASCFPSWGWTGLCPIPLCVGRTPGWDPLHPTHACPISRSVPQWWLLLGWHWHILL